jgi:hypothetical protein
MTVLRFIASIIILAGVCPRLAAAELTARDLASPNMAVMFEVNRPVQLSGHALARDLWGLLKQTTTVQHALTTAEFDKFRQAARFIEKSLGVDWHIGLSKLTSGGIIFVVQAPQPQREPDVTVVVTASDAPTLTQFMTAVEAEIRRAAGDNKGPEPEAASYRSYELHRVGNGLYTVAGRQLVVSNTRLGLEAALDRLAGAAAEKPFDLPSSLRMVDGRGNSPTILATVNLGLFRQDEKASALLKIPADDPAPQVLLGGYLDLLRRADFAAVGMFADGSSFDFKVRIPAGSAGAVSSFAGFFATDSTESAPPLLKPPGVMFSAAWFRDYKRLWDARGELLNANFVRQFDVADAGARSQPTGFGISDVLHWLGPHFRVVAARQREQVYPRKVAERLPAVGLVVSVRNETAVRDRLLPPVDGLLLIVLNNLIEDFKKVDYRDARITTFRFSEQAAGSGPGQAWLMHSNPAFTLTRGQLIIGSTAEIVRDLIDELDRQQDVAIESPPLTEHVTDRQQLLLGEVIGYLAAFHERIVRDLARTHGQSSDVAEKEVHLFSSALERIGRIATSHVIASDHFEMTLTVGLPAGPTD